MRLRFRMALVDGIQLGRSRWPRPRSRRKCPLDALLDRAGWYLDSFIAEFENVVAEEHYTQDASTNLPSFSPVAGGRGGAGAQMAASDLVRARHRALRSDFLLVKSPETDALVPFRDVIEVDGVQVRDREARLAKLFLNATPTSVDDTMARAERIREEGARYNLGSMRSTLGNPVLGARRAAASVSAALPLHAREAGSRDRARTSRSSTYKEVASPAMIRGEAGLDLPAYGRAWIDTVSGRVLKTSCRSAGGDQRRRDDDLPSPTRAAASPSRARCASSTRSANGNRVHMVATYGRFRRFDVSADEDIHTPPPAVVEPWTGMTLVEVPAGRFTMGSPSSEAGRNEDETLHDVELTRAVPARTVRGDAAGVADGDGQRAQPFRRVRIAVPGGERTFDEVQQFMARLNARTTTASGQAVRLRFRLPSEAEWEYACRANTTGPFSTGENMTTAQANYNGTFPYPPAGKATAGEFRQKPMAVGSFPFNPWGSPTCTATCGSGRRTGTGRIPRSTLRTSTRAARRAATSASSAAAAGRSTRNSARCGLRYTHAPKDRGYSLGFRVAAERLP